MRSLPEFFSNNDRVRWGNEFVVFSNRVAIGNFFVNSKNLGILILLKKCVNYDKIEFAARKCKSHI